MVHIRGSLSPIWLGDNDHIENRRIEWLLIPMISHDRTDDNDQLSFIPNV